VAFARIEREIQGGRFHVVPSEGFPFFICADLIRSEHLVLGQELTEAEFSVLQKLQNTHDCRAQALVYLARREHTAKELQQKLQQKGFSQPIIKQVLEDLEAENLLSEYRYALLMIESRQRKNPEGRILMAQRLSAKGVGRQEAEKALDELYTPELTTEYVQKAYRQVLDKHADTDQARFLLQKKGFSSYEIRTALESFSQNE
jgi:regulatory protein